MGRTASLLTSSQPNIRGFIVHTAACRDRCNRTDPADKVLHEIEEMGERSFIPSIGPDKGKILAKLVRDKKPKRILEVGALYGYSAILMAKNAPEAEVVTVEKSPEHAGITKNNVKRAGLENRINVIEGDATKVLPKIQGTFDLVFLDANKGEYLAYLKAVEKRLPKGGVVVADNVGIFKDEMPDFLDYVRNRGRYKSRTVETLLEFSTAEKDAMEISEKMD
ncbi:MAG TPA: O-methyltransferase [Candidatus Bathyarchaeia archaeon]|nr:O-methyltransferase [Candidatus Bathyarchaeia archaeon]